jgi:catechol 2,3-dioxygenase-like lactoylglutathione lyase family enzyme
VAASTRRLDHVVVAVRDLDAAIASYRALGFDVRPGGRHTGRGTHNAIIRFGLDYLELIAVRDEAEARRGGRSELLDSVAAGEGLVAYALATDDIEAEARGLAAAGMTAIGPFAMERQRPDGSRLSWRLVIPGDGSYRRPWPFFIQWDQPDAERLARDGGAAHPNGASGIRSVAVGAHDLGAARQLYGGTIGLPPSGPDGFAAGDARIVLAEREREGPFAIELAAATDAELDLAAAAGARIRLRAN